tara:strand:+ start:1077 stop:1448 length:372 start_codon:yes stop_codon:yes gene_type:complete
MGIFDWFRRTTGRKPRKPIVADAEGKSPYEQAKEILAQKETVIKTKIKEGEVTLEKFEKAPVLKEAPKPKRARTKKGTYKADDESTPDVNEAWEGGKAPKKKATAKKPTAKKTTIKRVKKTGK